MAFKKRQLKFIFLGFLVFFILLIFIVGRQNWQAQNNSEKASINFNNQIINAEVARSPYQLYSGLSNRESICVDCGMLFIFPDFDERSFVMRDMNFPLDIIFIAKGRVIKIFADLPPEGANPQKVYTSDAPVDEVLEINAGRASAWGLQVGDNLSINLHE